MSEMMDAVQELKSERVQQPESLLRKRRLARLDLAEQLG